MVLNAKTKERSMFLEPETFDVHTMVHGSGWKGIHVKVKKWMTPAGVAEPILISRDALTPEEFDLHIDELIDLLNGLRAKGKRTLATLKAQGDVE